MKNAWQVQEAKNKFSWLLKRAEEEPQIITKNGRKAGVLLSYEDYERRFKRERLSVRKLFSKAPKFDANELDLSREKDTGRDFSL